MSNIIDGLRWLDDWPVGLKLNTPLSRLFCETYIGMTTIWQRTCAKDRGKLSLNTDVPASDDQLLAKHKLSHRLVTDLFQFLWREYVYIGGIGHGLPGYSAFTVRHLFKRCHLSSRDGVAVHAVEPLPR